MDENENNVKIDQAAEKSQEIVGNENVLSTEQKPAKQVLIRREFAIKLVIIVALVILLSLAIGMLLDKTFNSGINSAEEQISIRTEFIEQIDIPGFSLTSLQSSVGGDSLNASASSARVASEFTGEPITGTQLETFIDNLMEADGYQKQEEYYGYFRNYDFEREGQEIIWIGTYYSNGTQKYAVNYYLDEPFICTMDISCLDPWGSYNGSGSESDKFQLSSLLEREFTRISINNGSSAGQLP